MIESILLLHVDDGMLLFMHDEERRVLARLIIMKSISRPPWAVLVLLFLFVPDNDSHIGALYKKRIAVSLITPN